MKDETKPSREEVAVGSDSNDGLGDWLVGRECCRKPYGRTCRVIAINDDKVKVKDGGWVGWVNRVTFLTDWAGYRIA